MGRLNKRQSKKEFKKMIYIITGKKLKVPRAIFKGGLNTLIGLPLYMSMITVSIAVKKLNEDMVNATNKMIVKLKDSTALNQTIHLNDQGGEIVTLPDGSQVIPNDISKQIELSNINKTIKINKIQ